MNSFYSDQLQFEIKSTTGNWNPPFHIHNFCEIYLLLEGEAEICVNDSRYQIHPGTLMMFNDHEMHAGFFQAEGLYKRCFIHIPPTILHHYSTPVTRLSACFYQRELGKQNAMTLSPEQTGYFMEKTEGMIHAQKTKPFGYDLLIHSYLLQILVMINTQFAKRSFSIPLTDQYPPAIQGIIAYIEAHLLENLTLDQIASVCSLDKYYMCHLFKKETGTTIFRFLLLKRIMVSRILLAEGKNVTEACFLSGFDNYTNFITNFKKCTGCTPKKYKDTLKYNEFN